VARRKSAALSKSKIALKSARKAAAKARKAAKSSADIGATLAGGAIAGAVSGMGADPEVAGYEVPAVQTLAGAALSMTQSGVMATGGRAMLAYSAGRAGEMLGEWIRDYGTTPTPAISEDVGE